MIVRRIPFDEISLNMSDIYLGMGSSGYIPDPDMESRINDILSQIAGICRPCYGYEIVPVRAVERREIVMQSGVLTTGTVITKYMSSADTLALFIATSGVEFEHYLQQIKSSGDIIEQFIADAIGSEIAEATARLMSETLSEEQSLLDNRISNSYSPGYCGWHVSDQQKLFSMLPDAPCGVTLSASSLMTPIKSVSGIIAIGRNVEKMPYGCAICAMKTCYKNRNNKGVKA